MASIVLAVLCTLGGASLARPAAAAQRWALAIDSRTTGQWLSVRHGVVYCVRAGRVVAIDLRTGRLRWTSAVKVEGRPAIGGRTIYAPILTGVIALDAASGRELGRLRLLEHVACECSISCRRLIDYAPSFGNCARSLYNDRHGVTLINSLSRGLQILRLLAQADRPLGVTDIAERLSVDPSTSYRLLATLENHGFIRQGSSKKYMLGFGVVDIASALLRGLDVVTIAPNHLRALMNRTGESAHLAVADANRAAIVAQVSAPGMLRVDTPIGSSEPLYCTAVGKALLADAEPLRLKTLLGAAPFERYSPNTITTIDMLVSELQRIRERGYALDDEELHPGVRCIAVGVRDHTGKVVAAVGISAPASRLTRELNPQLVAAVQQTAHDLSAELGYPQRPVEDAAASS